MAMGSRLPDDGDETAAVFSEINITPLTDIFLVLLIIFMVGASMAVQAASGQSGSEQTGMQIDLPSGSAKDLDTVRNDVSVAILADGRVVIGGEEIRDEAVEERLRAAHGSAASATLIVQADEGVPHGRVVAVMEKARAAGFTRLAVATRGQ
ncbi:ExbD/TolR family protein [Vulgatibacter sp.]|uniref:ExbD/TolR family protein n=1 Tax=Vulgatibacter sp. TaxID=1971226 RepID=UPI00356AAC9D